MKMKVCLSIGEMDQAFSKMKSELEKIADVEVVGLDNYSLEGVHVFIGKKMSQQALSQANCLKAVFAYKTGVEDFPLSQLCEKNIVLANSHADSDYIARYAFALSLALVSRIAEYDRRMRDGDWCAQDACWHDLFAMKVGLVGFGSIGQKVNEILRTNGLETYTLDRGKTYRNVSTVKTIEELCDVCNLLILSLPATSQTDKMFDSKMFARLKGKFIVNVGRSNCIDEQALFDSLNSGELAGAAIDTWREKPQFASQKLLPFDCPFHTLPNIVLSSHKAMQVSDGHERYVMDVLQNVKGYIETGKISNIVDLKKGY